MVKNNNMKKIIIVLLVLFSLNASAQFSGGGTATGGVLSEFGSVILANQIFSTNTFVNSTNGVFTIPSAGTWRLRYDITTDGTGANTNSQIQIVNNVGVLVAGTERTRGGSVTSALTLTAEVIITTTGATTYTLQGRSGGSGSITVFNTAINTSSISWEKIGGYSPITGSTVDYVSVRRITSNQTGIAINTDVIYNSIAAGNIPYNTSTGVFTLTAGKTYDLFASAKIRNDGTGGTGRYAQFEWVDALSNTPINGLKQGVSIMSTSVLNESGTDNAGGIYTPSTNQTVKVRITGIDGTNVELDQGRTAATITQIGSTATTGLNLNLTTTGSGAANYNSGTSTLNIPVITGKILVLSPSTLTGVLNGVTFSTTWADPISLTTSTNMTGVVNSDVTNQAIGVNLDAWLSGLSSGTGARLQRWRVVQNGTSINFGIYGAAYSCTFSGYVTIGSFEYKISGYAHAGTLGKMFIQVMH